MKNLIYVLAVIFLFACAGEEVKEEIVEDNDTVSSNQEADMTVYPATWDDVFSNNLQVDKIISIEGYLADPGLYVSQSSGTMSIHIYPKRNQSVGEGLYFTMPIGSSPNQVKELPEEFSLEDFIVVDMDGEEMTAGTKVLVELNVNEGVFDEKLSFGFRSIKKLEAAVVSSSQFDSAVELTDEILEDSTKKEVYGWAEGSFELPMMVFENNGRLRITFKNRTNKEINSIAIPVGDGPSTMDDLPEDFTDKDFVVRDYEGNPITGKRVRIYGTWHKSEYSNDGLFYLEEIVAK